MCCCGKPNTNGQPGYSWDGKSFGTRAVDPPDLADGDVLMCDEPGRCGGVDSHSHHFRLVKAKHDGYYLLVRHGAGDERIPLGYRGGIIDAIQTLALRDFKNSDRYWLLHNIYTAIRTASEAMREKRDAVWRAAAVEKRIKTRKFPRRGTVRVWIEPASAA